MSSDPSDLEPDTRRMHDAFYAEIERRLMPPMRTTHTYRSLDEQLHIWSKGREKLTGGVWIIVDPKLVVTRAKPGASAHNFHAAFDVCFASRDPYPRDPDLWEAVGRVGESVGLVWGGRWKSIVDKPHFEAPNWRDLRRLWEASPEGHLA